MPTGPFDRLESAREFMDAGRPDRAAAALGGKFPQSLAGEGAFLLAEALRAQGFFSRAQAAYRTALASLGPDECDFMVTSWLGLARCARSLGQIRSARLAMAQARASARRGDEGLAQTLTLEDALVDRAEGK